MNKGQVFDRWGIVVIVMIVTFLGVQAAKAVPPEGIDFTVVADGAEYKAGELIVRFAPKEDKSQLSRTEKTQILYLQLKMVLDIMR